MSHQRKDANTILIKIIFKAKKNSNPNLEKNHQVNTLNDRDTNTQHSSGYKNHLLLVVPASQTELVEEGKGFPAGQKADEGP